MRFYGQVKRQLRLGSEVLCRTSAFGKGSLVQCHLHVICVESSGFQQAMLLLSQSMQALREGSRKRRRMDPPRTGGICKAENARREDMGMSGPAKQTDALRPALHSRFAATPPPLRGPPIACAMKVSHCILSRLRLPTNAVRLLFPSKEGRLGLVLTSAFQGRILVQCHLHVFCAESLGTYLRLRRCPSRARS